MRRSREHGALPWRAGRADRPIETDGPSVAVRTVDAVLANEAIFAGGAVLAGAPVLPVRTRSALPADCRRSRVPAGSSRTACGLQSQRVGGAAAAVRTGVVEG